MNGEDKDCYWSYMGPTGGQYLLHLHQKCRIGWSVSRQHGATPSYNRNFNANPTSMYGMALRRQEQAALERADYPPGWVIMAGTNCVLPKKAGAAHSQVGLRAPHLS